MSPDELVSRHHGQKEEAAVTPAQHPSSLVGKSWTREARRTALNELDLPVPTYVPWLGQTVEHPEGYGIYFQQRWDEALQAIRSSSTSTTGTNGPPASIRRPRAAHHPVHAPRQHVLLRGPVQRRVQPLHPADEGRLHRQLLHADGPEHPPLQRRSPYPGTASAAPDQDRRQISPIGLASRSSTATPSATRSTATTTATAGCTTRTTRAATTSSPARSPWTGTRVYFYAETKEALTPHTGTQLDAPADRCRPEPEHRLVSAMITSSTTEGRSTQDHDAHALRARRRRMGRGSRWPGCDYRYAGKRWSWRCRASCWA